MRRSASIRYAILVRDALWAQNPAVVVQLFWEITEGGAKAAVPLRPPPLVSLLRGVLEEGRTLSL